MAGGMEANKNKFIEDWGSARETLEQNFRWTRRNFALIGLFGIALPVLVYKGIVKEFVISISLPPFLVSYVIFEWKLLRETEVCMFGLWCSYVVQENVCQNMQDEDAGRPYRKFIDLFWPKLAISVKFKNHGDKLTRCEKETILMIHDSGKSILMTRGEVQEGAKEMIVCLKILGGASR
ncbi:hypothetical protein DKX38_009307 [Salix brachista]|uniref:Uncharacterized protein n=1 Tax=Salix brachista TaxID=2182728 RepID=A0A5N5MD30_9ROSI|nr:hypothetical protein DKX38_009307 [Salix brachista]